MSPDKTAPKPPKSSAETPQFLHISLPFSGFQLWGWVPWDEEECSHGVHVTQGCKGNHKLLKGTHPAPAVSLPQPDHTDPVRQKPDSPGREEQSSTNNPTSNSTALATEPHHYSTKFTPQPRKKFSEHKEIFHCFSPLLLSVKKELKERLQKQMQLSSSFFYLRLEKDIKKAYLSNTLQEIFI